MKPAPHRLLLAAALSAGGVCWLKLIQMLWIGLSTGQLIDKRGVAHAAGSAPYIAGCLTLALGSVLLAFWLWRGALSIRSQSPGPKGPPS